VEWAEFDLTIEKAVVDFMITDEATIRGKNQLQARMSMRRAAEAIAYQKEYDMIRVLEEHVSTSTPDMSVAAADYWDNWDSADRAISDDITTGVAAILHNSNITVDDIQNISLLVPARAYPAFMTSLQIENIVTSLKAHLGRAFGINIVPSKNVYIDRKSTETEKGPLGSKAGHDANCFALLLVNGPGTAMHGVYTGGAVPLSERERIQGVGYNYTVTQYFGTGVVPESLDAVNVDTSNTYRVYKIESVVE